MIELEDALASYASKLSPLPIEMIDTADALDRVLAQDIHAMTDLPRFDQSAMDGYALRSIDLAGADEVGLRVAGEALAGRPYPAVLGVGECVLITTGAVLPAGCDCVVPQELVAATR